MVSVWDWSARYCTYRRERPSFLDLLAAAVRFRINFWLDGWGFISSLEIEPILHLSVEGLRPWDWSYPVLQYLREWPTPTVVSSLSRVLSLNTNQHYKSSSILNIVQNHQRAMSLYFYHNFVLKWDERNDEISLNISKYTEVPILCHRLYCRNYISK